MVETAVILEREGVILNKANQLTNYIENSRKIKKFRDEKCKFINYRALDMKLWKVGENHLTPPEFFKVRKEDFMKNEFEKWMKEVENKLPSTAYNYTLSIDKISKHYSENTDKYLDIYNETDLDLLRNISKDYSLDGKYSDFGNYGNGTIRNAIATYIRFSEDMQRKQKIENSSKKKHINNIHSLIYDINKDKTKKENWTRYILEFHKQWLEENKYLPLKSNSKYIWGEKVVVDPDLEIVDVFGEDMDKIIVRFFNVKAKSLIRDINEEDLIQLVFLNNIKFIDFKRVINKLLLENEDIGNIEIVNNVEKTKDESLNLASKSINNIKNELNTFKNILDYYETTIIQLNQTIDTKDEIIIYQENIINGLEEKIKENEESLKELEHIKEKLEEIKRLLEKV